jgi:hypothetical protein
LPGTALPVQEHGRCRTRGHLPHQRLDGHERGTAADDPVEAVGLRLVRAKRLDLAPQPRGFQRFLDQQDDFVQVERLVGEVIRPCFIASTAVSMLEKRGQQDDQDVGIALLQFFEDLESVAVGQLVIQEDEVDPSSPRAMADAAVSASMTRYPSSDSRSFSDQRISCSSSTTRMVGAGTAHSIARALR